MDLVYSIPLLGLLALTWIAARRVAKKMRGRETLRRRKRRARAKQVGEPDAASPRSDMRATDAPGTLIDTIRKRAKDPDG
jgi:hypothetical protein